MLTVEFINERIHKNIKKYTLPQAIRVIMHYLKLLNPHKETHELFQSIRFKSNPSLSFQKSEVQDIVFYDTSNRIQVEVTINFLGIFGSSSPLPSHYSESVLKSYDEDNVLVDFLNLFNNNLQKFIYPIWEKQRYYIQFQKNFQDKFSKYMLSVLGLYSNLHVQDSKLNFNKLMPYIGLLSMRQKSAGTLASILRHYLDFKKVDIEQCMVMDSKIPSWQYPQLGTQNSTLGESFMIGEFVKNKTSKFRILLKNATANDMVKYSILGNKMDELNDLIRFIFHEPLEYDVCLQVKKKKKIRLKLQENSPRYLGINCWIGEPSYDEKIIITQKG